MYFTTFSIMGQWLKKMSRFCSIPFKTKKQKESHCTRSKMFTSDAGKEDIFAAVTPAVKRPVFKTPVGDTPDIEIYLMQNTCNRKICSKWKLVIKKNNTCLCLYFYRQTSDCVYELNVFLFVARYPISELQSHQRTHQ